VAGALVSTRSSTRGFVNADPQSWNAYSCVRNNPVNLTPERGDFCRHANDTEKGQGSNY